MKVSELFAGTRFYGSCAKLSTRRYFITTETLRTFNEMAGSLVKIF